MHTRTVIVTAVLAYAAYRYLAYCRRFVAHERERAEREPGFSGGVNSTS